MPSHVCTKQTSQNSLRTLPFMFKRSENSSEIDVQFRRKEFRWHGDKSSARNVFNLDVAAHAIYSRFLPARLLIRLFLLSVATPSDFSSSPLRGINHSSGIHLTSRNFTHHRTSFIFISSHRLITEKQNHFETATRFHRAELLLFSWKSKKCARETAHFGSTNETCFSFSFHRAIHSENWKVWAAHNLFEIKLYSSSGSSFRLTWESVFLRLPFVREVNTAV